MAVFPRKLDSKYLIAQGEEGEAQVVVILEGTGGRRFQFQGENRMTFIFEYDQKYRKLALRVPISVWKREKNLIPRSLFCIAGVQWNAMMVPIIESPPNERTAEL